MNEMKSESVTNYETGDENTSPTPDDTEEMENYLTFSSAGLIFGVSTDQVAEIITNHNICTLPLLPDYIQGIINLRGQIIPIIDMRLRLGKPFVEYTATTCVIILEIGNDRIGIGVDSVLQVVSVDPSRFSPIPLESSQKMASSMLSLDDGKVILLLDCDSLSRP